LRSRPGLGRVPTAPPALSPRQTKAPPPMPARAFAHRRASAEPADEVKLTEWHGVLVEGHAERFAGQDRAFAQVADGGGIFPRGPAAAGGAASGVAEELGLFALE